MTHGVSDFERIRNFCVYEYLSVISIWQADKHSFNILKNEDTAYLMRLFCSIFSPFLQILEIAEEWSVLEFDYQLGNKLVQIHKYYMQFI